MFICTVQKANRTSSKRYECFQLVESIRTEKGVRQKLLLSLGRLSLSKDERSRLAKRIEAIFRNQMSLFEETVEIEALAKKFVHQIIAKHGIEMDAQTDDFETVDTKSLQNHRVRQIGGEYLGTAFFNRLKLHECFNACGFSQRQIEIAMLLIIGRLVHPGSELHLFRWAQHVSGLDELINTDFNCLSQNSLYKMTDLIYEHKTEIEAHLRV
jgi:hypothetical protein